MRLIILFLTTAIIQVSASSYGQNVTLKKENASLKTVLDDIRKQTGYDFFYSDKTMRSATSISIDVKNVSLVDALEICFKDQLLTYTIESKSVTIKPKEPSFLDSMVDRVKSVFADTDTDVRGRVVDEQGNPMPNASIQVKGKSQIYKSNEKGEFVIANVPDDGVLVIRYVGYKQLEISLKDAVMPLEIKLNVATGELEEVKVVYNTGYQELNKERATGSFVHIDNELFNRRVSATVLDRISDLVPGLLFRSGNPNQLDGTTIRGVSTFTADKAPLLVVDNFVYSGDPSKLNPNDVESITILRDAAAASIWGVRAGNGVIVITMKKGRTNSIPAISFNTNLTIEEKPDLFSLPIVSSRDVITLERKRFTDGFYNSNLNSTSYPVLSQIVEILAGRRTGAITEQEANSQIAAYENHDVRNDVNKYLLQTSIAQQYALNISGGANNYHYYGAVGYDKVRPTDVNRSNDRLTIRFNNSWTPIKKLQINAQLNWGQSTGKSSNALGGYGVVLTSPYLRLADENGGALAIPKNYRMMYVDTVNFPGKLDWHYRPLEEARNGNEISKNYNTVINGSLNYSILQGFNINVGYNWQKNITDVTSIQGINTFETRDRINTFVQKGADNLPLYPYPLGGVYGQGSTDQVSWTYRGGLNFNRRFGKHELNSLIGTERSETRVKSFDAPGQYGYNPETNVFGAVRPGNWVTRPGGGTRTIGVSTARLNGELRRFGSYYGNIGYTYHEKYTFTTSGRIDQSNFFGVEANDRKVPLWHVGLAWSIAKEGFYAFSQLPVLTLRVTYGYAGNVNAGTSPLVTGTYQPPIDPAFVPYAIIATPPNPELRWEKVRTVNLGLDFENKNQRISGSFDFYQKRGLDLISPITVDPTSGFSTYTGNSSSVQTRGVEISLNTQNIYDTKFKWTSSINFSYQQDKVLAYTVDPPVQGRLTGIFIGKPLSSLYSYRWAGLNPLNGGAQVYFREQIISSADYQKLDQRDLKYSGQSSPPIFGSFISDFQFKNVSLLFSVGYQFGHYFRRLSFGGSFSSSWQHEDYLEAWQSPGDELITSIPGFLNTYPDSRYTVYTNSDILIEKADHVRLQYIRLRYSLNRDQLKGLIFKNIGFYINVNNIGFIWNASKYNPDTRNGLSTPQQRSIAFGLNVNF